MPGYTRGSALEFDRITAGIISRANALKGTEVALRAADQRRLPQQSPPGTPRDVVLCIRVFSVVVVAWLSEVTPPLGDIRFAASRLGPGTGPAGASS